MKEFEPSPHFVPRVMSMVRAEAESGKERTPWPPALSSAWFRYSVALGGALVTLGNLFRILAPFFTPALCR